MSTMYDIIIVGSGIVGATTALALAKETSLKIAVIEAKRPSNFQDTTSYDHRVSAISLASKRILQNLNCWDSIKANRFAAYTHMHVWDANGTGEIQFDHQSVNEPVLGYIIEDRVIRQSLLEQFSLYPTIDYLCPASVVSMQEKNNAMELLMQDQTTLITKLLVAADGADSWVRAQANIEMENKAYPHTAIVASVTTALPHQSTARQRFLSTGPLAFLPFRNPYDCSIVWSVEHAYAKELVSLDDASFKKCLGEAFAYQLGEIISVSSRHSFPLRMRHVKQYVRSRLALVGDAAHTIHPLAGQGVNLGMLDAVALAEVISDACKKKRDYSSLATLRCYERWRKSDVVALLTMVSVLAQLFGSERGSVKKMRTIGLGIVNNFPIIKTLLVDYALGKRRDLPKLSISKI